MAFTLFPAAKLLMDKIAKEDAPVNNGRGTITVFMAGLGIGFGLALLFAPLSVGCIRFKTSWIRARIASQKFCAPERMRLIPWPLGLIDPFLVRIVL